MFDWMRSETGEREGVWRLFRKRMVFILLLVIGVFICIGYTITVGSADIGFFDVYKILVNQIFPDAFDVGDRADEIVVTTIRAPRVLMGVAVGMILATGGCIVQSVLRNPLATPYTLGISSSACFGAALAISFGLRMANSTIAVIMSAFIFSMIPVSVILMAAARRSVTPVTLVLCGVAISQVFSACNTILQYFASPETTKDIVFWAVGSLNECSMWMVPYVGITSLVFVVAALYLSRDLNILKMGDDTAESLGINANNVRLIAIVIACVCTAVAVAFTGAIGFVCLISPQVCRIIIGGELKYLIPSSALVGAILLIVADTIGRTVIAPTILPVGAITALIGGPLLVYMLMKRNNSMSV